MFLFQLIIAFSVMLFVLFPMFGKLIDDYPGYIDNLLSGAYWTFKGVFWIVVAAVFFWSANGVIEGLL